MNTEVRTRFRIDVPHARAWKLLRNLELSDRYVPGVRGCTITSRKREGVGASRRIEQNGRPAMQETVIEWRDGVGFTLKLHPPDSERAPCRSLTRSFAIALPRWTRGRRKSSSR